MNLRDESGFVRITELHLVDGDRAFPRRSALGRFENESSAMSNRYRFVSSRDWIFDWLQRDSEIVTQPGRAFESIDRHVERNELRLEQSGEGCRQNFERKTAGLSGADGK